MYDEVLLPTDGSEETTSAVAHAGDLASQYDATVHVLSVVDARSGYESSSAGLTPAMFEEAGRERAEAATEEAAADLPDDVRVERVHRQGVPKTEILEYAESTGVDVVVMGTHGRTGLDHYLIGSVTEKVVRRSSVPVMTVRRTDP